MKVLIGLSNGLLEEQEPYKMYIVDVDSFEPTKQEWQDLNIVEISKCVNVRVNMGNYKSVLQNPTEYLEAEFDISKLIDLGVNQSNFQITNVYLDESGEPSLFRTVNSLGQVIMHDISELFYKKKFSIYGDDIEELPSYVKKEPLNNAYEWWRKKEKSNKIPKKRFIYDNFDTNTEMPVKLLYHYLVGVKNFQLGYHTATEKKCKNLAEMKHEYFLFKDTANIKLTESVPLDDSVILDEVGIYGNKDPYPDKQKLGFYGATMSLLCNRKNYPTFDLYEKPISESSYDKEGISVTIDATNDLISIYNKLEDAKCISNTWRLGEYNNLSSVTISNLLNNELNILSKKLQNEKEKNDYGHWSTYHTNDWMQVMALALSTQYYSAELRKSISPILQNYQEMFSKKLDEMIEMIGAKDALEVMKWSKENTEEIMHSISLIKEDGSIQNSNITFDQTKSLFTFKRNNFELPDWLQIYSPETIEKLGGESYLQQIISTRGEESAESFLAIWAEKIESDQRYAILEQDDSFLPQNEVLLDEQEVLEDNINY